MTSQARGHFVTLEQTDFQSLEHAPYLKGLLKPFKGKGSLEDWASVCIGLRDGLIGMAQRRVLAQACTSPYSLLPIRLTGQSTSAGTTFLRWRNPDRSSMGVALWEKQILSPRTPTALLDDLLALELQRIALNMQVSLLHSIARQAREAALRAAQAEACYQRRIRTDSIGSPTTLKEFPL